MDRAFALIGESVVFPKCYTRSEGKSQLLRRALSDSRQQMLEAVDEAGAFIDGIFTAVAEGPASICTLKLPGTNCGPPYDSQVGHGKPPTT
jgi:hypothetical protein